MSNPRFTPPTKVSFFFSLYLAIAAAVLLVCGLEHMSAVCGIASTAYLLTAVKLPGM